VWTSGEAPWITADVWDASAGAPDIPEGAEVVLGVDASIRHDTTAIVVVRRDKDDVNRARPSHAAASRGGCRINPCWADSGNPQVF
jgi:phage terminase large subunit-like protein